MKKLFFLLSLLMSFSSAIFANETNTASNDANVVNVDVPTFDKSDLEPVVVKKEVTNSGTVTLSASNMLLMDRPFRMGTVSKAIAKLQELHKKLPKGQPIYIFFDTPGGSVYAGKLFIDAARGLNRKIHTISIYSASMGFLSVQALGNRYVTSGGVLMSHRAWMRMGGEVGGEFESRYNLWSIYGKDLSQISASRAGLSLDDYKQKIRDEYWCSGHNCVADGFADKVVNIACDDSLSKVRTHTLAANRKLKLVAKKSDCPIAAGYFDYEITDHYGNTVRKSAPEEIHDILENSVGFEKFNNDINRKKVDNLFDKLSK